MIIDHTVLVGGQNVDKDVISVRADQTVEQSESDRIDIVLANGHGKYDGAFITRDAIVITLIQIKKSCTNPDKPWSIKLVTGEVQKVDYTHSEVKIEGSCMGGTLADALEDNLAFYEQPALVIIEAILATHIDPPIKINRKAFKDPTHGTVNKQTDEFSTEISYASAMDRMGELVGCIWYFDENGEFCFIPPEVPEAKRWIEDYIINEGKAYSCIGHCNVVTVIGAGVHPTGDGREIETTKCEAVGHAENPESIAIHGRLIAPQFSCPELTTEARCQERADKLLEFYEGKANIAHPIIAGYSVPIRALVQYAINDTVVSGVVQRRITEYSAAGWTTRLDVSLGIVGGGGAVLADSDLSLEDQAEHEAEQAEDMTEEDWAQAEREADEIGETETEESEGSVLSEDYFTEDLGGANARYYFTDVDSIKALLQDTDYLYRDISTPRSDDYWNQLTYNPATGDRVIMKSNQALRDGYYIVYPWSDTTSTNAADQFATIQDGGWPA